MKTTEIKDVTNIEEYHMNFLLDKCVNILIYLDHIILFIEFRLQVANDIKLLKNTELKW